MSISLAATSNILSSAVPQTKQATFRQQRNADFQKLESAISSGDLAAARQAYSSLQDLFKSSKPATAGLSAHPEAAKQFEAIGQALQNGDVKGAKEALAAFEKIVQPKAGGPNSATVQKVDSDGDSDGSSTQVYG